MNWKHSLAGVILLLCFTTGVSAQIHGLSLLDMADSPGRGAKHFVGGTFMAESSALYGGRLAYGVADRILVFTDMGVHDADYFDPEFLGQAGMRYTLPVNLPFDLAFRVTTIPYIASYEHYVEFTVGLLASRYLGTNMDWAVYGNLGVDRQFWELKVRFDPDKAALYGQDHYIDKGNKTEKSLTLGISKKLTNRSRFFIEGAHIDEYYCCSGIRFEL